MSRPALQVGFYGSRAPLHRRRARGNDSAGVDVVALLTMSDLQIAHVYIDRFVRFLADKYQLDIDNEEGTVGWRLADFVALVAPAVDFVFEILESGSELLQIERFVPVLLALLRAVAERVESRYPQYADTTCMLTRLFDDQEFVLTLVLVIRQAYYSLKQQITGEAPAPEVVADTNTLRHRILFVLTGCFGYCRGTRNAAPSTAAVRSSAAVAAPAAARKRRVHRRRRSHK